MSFKCRKGIFGRAVLQVGSKGAWQDADITEFLQDEFFILSATGLRKLQDQRDRAEALANSRGESLRRIHLLAVQKARRHKKRIPTLTDMVSP